MSNLFIFQDGKYKPMHTISSLHTMCKQQHGITRDRMAFFTRYYTGVVLVVP